MNPPKATASTCSAKGTVNVRQSHSDTMRSHVDTLSHDRTTGMLNCGRQGPMLVTITSIVVVESRITGFSSAPDDRFGYFVDTRPTLTQSLCDGIAVASADAFW